MSDADLPSPITVSEAAVRLAFSQLALTASGYTYTFDVMRELFYSSATLSDDMEQQPGKVAWWNSVVAILSDMLGRAKRSRDVAAAQCRKQARTRLVATGQAATIQAVDDEVLLDKTVAQKEEVIFQLELLLERSKGIVKALQDRREMMLEESRRQIVEMKSDLCVKKKDV